MVRTAVNIAGVIWRHSRRSEINPQSSVGEDRVGQYGIAGAVALDEYSCPRIEGDDVSLSSASPTDEVVAFVEELHTIAAVAQGRSTGGIRPNSVALDLYDMAVA